MSGNPYPPVPPLPPQGIPPVWVWKGRRMDALIEAIARWTVAGYAPPQEWYSELTTLVQDPDTQKWINARR